MSPVQVMGLAVVERQDQYERALARLEDHELAVRTALLTALPTKAQSILPVYFPPDEDDLEARIEQDDLTPEVNDDIEKWLAERGGVITGADLLDDDEGWR